MYMPGYKGRGEFGRQPPRPSIHRQDQDDSSDNQPSEHVSILCLRQHSIRPSYVNSPRIMTLLKNIKTSGARLKCVGCRSLVPNFGSDPNLREPDRGSVWGSGLNQRWVVQFRVWGWAPGRTIQNRVRTPNQKVSMQSRHAV